MFPSVLLANSIVGVPVDWDTYPPSPDWSALSGEATLLETTGNGNATDWLQITFEDIGSTPGADWFDTVSGESSDLFALTWETDYWIEFDFWAGDVLPETLQVRWGVDGGRTWGNTVSPVAGVDSWGTIRTDSFSDYLNWQINPLDDEGEFLADLGAIDWIGVYIFRDGTDEEVYGVDDFKLMVPEPEEYLMLIAALVTAVLVLRRQRLATVPVKVA